MSVGNGNTGGAQVDGLSAEQAEMLREILDLLLAVRNGGQDEVTEFGLDGDVKRVPNDQSKLVRALATLTGDSKRVPNDQSKLLSAIVDLIGESKRVPNDQSKLVSVLEALLDEAKRVPNDQSKPLDFFDVFREEPRGRAETSMRVSIRNGYLILPVSFGDS